MRSCAPWSVAVLLVSTGCAEPTKAGTPDPPVSGDTGGTPEDSPCPPYTEADGAGGCEDINECAEDNGGCGDPAWWICENQEAAPPTCIDIDECAEDNGGCGDPAAFSCLNVEGGPPSCSYDWAAEWAVLMQDVSVIESGGSLPSRLVVWGETAFPLVVTEDDHVWAAAARAAEGKVLHFGHEAHLGGALSDGDTQILLGNALGWMMPDGGGTVAVERGLDSAATAIEAMGYTVVRSRASGIDPIEDLQDVDVWITTTSTEHDAEVDSEIRAWIEGGGGVISGGHAWWWAYSNEGADAYHDHPGNQWIGVAGITLSGDPATTAETDRIDGAPHALLHAGRALDAAAAHLDGTAPLDPADASVAGEAAGFAARVLPIDSAFFDLAREVLASVPPVIPTEGDPVEPTTEPIEALVLSVQDALNARTPAAELAPDPAADDFPGAVTGADGGPWSATVDLTYSGRDSRYLYSGAGAAAWRSTGVYLAPGEPVTVTMPPAAVGTGVDLQIGAHSDTLWHKDSWTRSPSVVRRYAVDAEATLVASAHGGPLYVRVPGGIDLGAVTVSADGGYPMARFVHGETDPTDWAAAVASTGAPWAELETAGVILTVPTADVSGLTDPGPLMEFWQAVLDAQAELAAIDTDRVRPERIVTDRQISAGWMHSGYPIMAHDDSAPDLVDLEGLQTTGDWGAFHELGHNHQWSPWHLPGATEATCNLWSVYTMEGVVGIDRSEAHSALAEADRQSRIDSYLAGGADFSGSWSVWTALETYLQLQETFGWEPILAVQARYAADSPADDPTTDQERIDRWVQRTSEETGRDLGAFYLAWGWPVSTDTLAAIDHLPDWTDHPMQ